MVAADDKSVVEMHLSGGECHDAPEGCKSIEAVGRRHKGAPMLMDKAYEGDDIRALARKNGHNPVVPPRKNRKKPWRYSKKTYKLRNVVERFFRRLDGFRRVYTRYDKTDIMFMAFIRFAVIMILLN
jgi:transposase